MVLDSPIPARTDAAPMGEQVDTSAVDRVWPRGEVRHCSTCGGEHDDLNLCPKLAFERMMSAQDDPNFELGTAGKGRRPRSDKGKPRESLTMSTSENATLAACPTKYFNSYELGRYASVEDKEAAEWGLYVHRSLAQFYRALRKSWPLALGYELAMRQIDRRGIDGGRRPYYPPTDPYARAMLRAVVHAYLVVWGPEDERDYEVLAVEKRYLMPALREDGTHRRGFFVDGVIDLARRHRGTGRVSILDHKTTQSDFEQPHLRPQRAGQPAGHRLC
jgi:hypothetical protein